MCVKDVISVHGDVILTLQFSPSELLHASAGVCSVSLPDMELSAIYNSLTANDSTVAIVLASPQGEHRELFSKHKGQPACV